MGRGKLAIKDSFSDVLGQRRGSKRIDVPDDLSFQYVPVNGDWKDIQPESGILLLFPRKRSIQEAELNLLYEQLTKMGRDTAPISLPSPDSIFIAAPDMVDRKSVV